METTIINANDVKKELYKTKVNAKFSHYVSGNLYYTVEVFGIVYQFPIATVEDKTEYVISSEDEGGDEVAIESVELSSDLGTTSFYSEMTGHSLNRWIVKAIDNNEFTKIN